MFRGQETMELRDLPLDVIVDVVSAKHRDCITPTLRYELEELLEKSSGDVLTLLGLWVKQPGRLCEDLSDLDAGRFPTSAFQARPQGGHHRELGFQVADSHLHSGATMPLALFLRALASRVSPIPFSKDLTWVSPSGGVWRLEPVLAAVRWALRFQTLVLASSGHLTISTLLEDGFTAEPLKALRKGTYWDFVLSATHERRHLIDDAPATKGGNSALTLNGSFRTRLACPDVSSLIWPSMTSPLEPQADRALRLGLCRGVALIGSAISSNTGEGLTRFARRFEQWSDLKKLAVGTDSDYAGQQMERDHVTMVLRDIAPTDEVVAAEFRKSFRESSAKAFRDEILSSLKTHHSSFAAFSKSRVIDLTMPVSFLRNPQQDRCPTSAGMLELQEVLWGVQALQTLRRRPGGDQLIAAIGAFDVVNDELGSTNWAFAVGAQLLATSVPELTYAIHAGESFFSQLNGLRRVGELFLSEIRPHRIGHALALSGSASRRIVSDPIGRMSRADALMDLCWVASCNQDFREDALEAIHVLTMPNRARRVIGAAEWVAAFEALHDLHAVKRLLLRDRGEGQWTLLPPAERNDLYRVGDPTSRAALTLAGAVDRASAELDLNGSLSGSLLEAYDRLDCQAVPQLRAELVEKCAEMSIIECCPTSNVRLAGLAGGMADHPFSDVTLRGVRKTISSDDPAIFGTSVLEEVSRLLDSGHEREAVLKAAQLSVETCASGIGNRPRGTGWYESVVANCG